MSETSFAGDDVTSNSSRHISVDGPLPVTGVIYTPFINSVKPTHPAGLTKNKSLTLYNGKENKKSMNYISYTNVA